jgi:tRNA (guanine37-N1)-methyltransferase
MIMRIDVLTLFPEMFGPVIGASILKRAKERQLLSVNVTNIRDYAFDKHSVVDDYPFGGGAGMVLKAEPVALAVEDVVSRARSSGLARTRIILMSPQGQVFKQDVARRLAQEDHLVLICGHYEGVDERVVELLVDEEISVGDYVLTGGEIPAMVVMDSVGRLLPGVLGCAASSEEESFSEANLLEYPQYTRPREFRGLAVPPVLLSGNHAEIAKWRRGQSLKRTALRRPDLFERHQLSAWDEQCLISINGRKEG